MTSTEPQLITASKARLLYWVLVGGLLVVMALFVLVVWLLGGPFLPGDAVISAAMALFALGPMTLGWFWARPNVPLRPQGSSPDTFWQDPNAGARALLLWVLWEGGSIIATVGSLLTGSVLTEAVAAIGLALLLTHSPAFFENRSQ